MGLRSHGLSGPLVCLDQKRLSHGGLKPVGRKQFISENQCGQKKIDLVCFCLNYSINGTGLQKICTTEKERKQKSSIISPPRNNHRYYFDSFSSSVCNADMYVVFLEKYKKSRSV